VERQFDTTFAYKLWLIPPISHRLYMKCWDTRFNVFRLATLNLFLLGWIVDGFWMDALNIKASKVDSLNPRP
jgi:hypothetical protein